MAKKHEEEAPAGSPAWMATFSDLMNLLLCFFVLLFSMSTVDAEKFEMVIASLQSSFSVLSGGSDTIGDGDLIGAGVSMMSSYDIYFNELMNANGTDTTASNGGDTDDNGEASGNATTQSDVKEQYEQMSSQETEEMADAVAQKAAELGVTEQMEIDYTSDYVSIQLNGALLFESGSADVKKDALPLLDKIGQILEIYPEHIIDIEGHTDNVPIHSSKFENNEVLSTFRALAVADYLMSVTDIDPYYMKYSGRGEYDPIADNSTAEGRAQNRRVEIRLYNSYNSN